MTTKNLLDDRHYVKLPICGFCQNAWDILFARAPWSRSAHGTAPGQMVRYCRVGGCDPDIWEYLDEDGDWNGRKVKGNNGTFHRRLDNDSAAPWRKGWPRIVAAFSVRRNSQYESVRDKNGFVVSKVLSEDSIEWDEEDEEPEETVEAVVVDPVW